MHDKPSAGGYCAPCGGCGNVYGKESSGGKNMDLLKEMLLKEATVVNSDVLKVDSLLNHGAHPRLTMEMGREFARRFKGEKITKVVTLESSGIPVAFCTAYELDVPLVFARRKKTLPDDEEVYSVRVPSYTRGMMTDLIISRELLTPKDSVLIIDDIIANGDAAKGLVRIIELSGARLAGIGIVLEKTFQTGGKWLRELGCRVETLVKIKSLENGQIVFE